MTIIVKRKAFARVDGVLEFLFAQGELFVAVTAGHIQPWLLGKHVGEQKHAGHIPAPVIAARVKLEAAIPLAGQVVIPALGLEEFSDGILADGVNAEGPPSQAEVRTGVAMFAFSTPASCARTRP